MDYRQLPGDPGEAESFSWSVFLDPDRRAPADPHEPPPTPEAERSVTPTVRTVTGIVVGGLLVSVLAYALPRSTTWTGSESIFAKILGFMGSESVLDGEIPVDRDAPFGD